MEFDHLLKIVGTEPVFETGLLLAGGVDVADVHKQLSRWTTAGRLYQLRRGLYALAPPYQKARPHPFMVANQMVRGSYVSCQSALAHYGHIPEEVLAVTSVASSRPGRWSTPLGSFDCRHIRPGLLWGYRRIELGSGQFAFIATPEKALLDLVHLQPGGDALVFLRELRLQNLDLLDLDELARQADRTSSPKLRRAASAVAELARAEVSDYEAL
jgi:predicted transcriptional regulator of viral defense system